MKFVTLLIFIPLFCFTQLKVNAGKDRYYCLGINYIEMDTLGASPTVQGGIEPYKYLWTVNDSLGEFGNKASNFLNDTTVANPILNKNKSGFNKNKKIFLKVIDSIGNIGFDTITVLHAGRFKTYDGYSYNKKRTDTISICSQTFSPDTPLRFKYYPFIMMNDTSYTGCIKTWMNNEFTYYAKAIDKYGCESNFGAPIEIHIIESSIQSINSVPLISNFHNPINEKSIFYFVKPNNIEKINIYNNLGQKIYTQNHSDILELGRHIKEKGFYYIVILNNQHTISPIKIQKE